MKCAKQEIQQDFVAREKQNKVITKKTYPKLMLRN